MTEKNIVNIWTGDRSEERKGGSPGEENQTRGEAGLDCMVITINNGNLVCKWLETPARAVPTYNFPPFRGRRALPPLSSLLPPPPPPARAVSHIEMPWVNICLRSCKLILFKCQVWEQKGAFGLANLIALSRFLLRDNDRFSSSRLYWRRGEGCERGCKARVKGKPRHGRVISVCGMSTVERASMHDDGATRDIHDYS